jgi:regulator of RNase E activity RraB
VIETLSQHGSDLSKPHDVEHHFVSSSREDLDRLARWARLNGFMVANVDDGHIEGHYYHWLDLIKPTVPTMENLTADMKLMLLLADQYDGVYDGWGCEVVD